MSFTNYKYKNVALTDMLHGITNSTVAAAYGTGNPVGGSGVPFSSIDEKPSGVGFKYNGTDISNWGIAKYYAKSSGHHTITVPSWCNKIRYAVCGAGGAGGSATSDHNAGVGYNHHGHYFTYWGQLYYYHYQGAYYYQTSSAKPGAGGGSGGFSYGTISVSPGSTVDINAASGGSGSGGHSYVKIGNTYYYGYGGGMANKTARGNSGGGTTHGTGITVNGSYGGYISGNSGGLGGEQSRSTNHTGRGGWGRTITSATSDSSAAGGSGQNGYAIIYLLDT